MGSTADVMRVRLSADGIQEVMDALKKVQDGTRKTADAAKGAQDTLGSLGTIFAAQKIAQFTAQALDAADQLYKMSQKTGVAVEQLSALDYVAKQADVSQEDLTKSFGKLAKSMDALHSGDSATIEAFKRIGLSAEDLKGMSLDQVMLSIANAQSGFADGAGKAAVMMQLFGKSGASLIPMLNDLSNGGFDQAKAKLQELGLVISSDTAKNAQDFNDSMTRLQMAAQGATVQVAQGMLPGLTKAVDALTQSLALLPDSAKTYSASFLAIGAAATATAVSVRALYTALVGLGPIGIAAVAISALAAGMITLSNAEEQARAEEIKSLENRSRLVASGSDLEKAYRKEAAALEKSSGNQKEAKKHADALRGIEAKLIELSPDLQSILKDESKGYREKAEAIKQAKEQAEALQKQEKKELEVALADVEAKLTRAKDPSEQEAVEQAQRRMAGMSGSGAGASAGSASARRVEALEESKAAIQAKLDAINKGTEEQQTKKEETKPDIASKADDSLGKARIAALSAQAKREWELEKQSLSVRSELNEDVYKQGMVSLETYLATRRTLLQEENDGEIAQLEKQKAAEEKTTAIAKTPAERMASETKIADLKNQITLKQREGEQKLQGLEREGRDKRKEAALEALKLEADLEEMKGKTGEAAVAAIRAEYEAKIQAAQSDPAKKAALGEMERLAVLKKRSEIAGNQGSQASTTMQNALAVVDQNQQAGKIGALEADQQRVQIYKDWLVIAQQVYLEQAKIAAESKDPALIANAEALRIQVEGVRNSVASLSNEWANVQQAGANALAGGLVDALSQIGNGVNAVDEGFRNMGRSIAQAVEQAIIKMMLLKAVESKFGGSPAGSFGAAMIQAFGGTVAKAEGGEISGPGTSTSDSILARLSDGEFVNRAASVAYYGPAFFHALNGMRVPRSLLPGFADGGLVGGAGAGAGGRTLMPAIKIVLVHNIEEAVQEQLRSRQGEKTVIQHVARNRGAF